MIYIYSCLALLSRLKPYTVLIPQTNLQRTDIYPPSIQHSTWNTGVGRWYSFWEGLLAGVMFGLWKGCFVTGSALLIRFWSALVWAYCHLKGFLILRVPSPQWGNMAATVGSKIISTLPSSNNHRSVERVSRKKTRMFAALQANGSFIPVNRLILGEGLFGQQDPASLSTAFFHNHFEQWKDLLLSLFREEYFWWNTIL